MGSRIVCLNIGTASWALIKIPPVLASEAEAGTPRMFLTSTWTGPLGLMDGGLDMGALERV